MVDEPDNIVLAQLREIREQLREQKDRFDAIDNQLAAMRDDAQRSQNIAFWALGRSEWALTETSGQGERLDDLQERVDVLEGASKDGN